MTIASERQPDGPPPVSTRERAIPFAPMAEMDMAAEIDMAAIPVPSHAQQTSGFQASRSEHCATVARLARSRRPHRVAKSP